MRHYTEAQLRETQTVLSKLSAAHGILLEEGEVDSQGRAFQGGMPCGKDGALVQMCPGAIPANGSSAASAAFLGQSSGNISLTPPTLQDASLAADPRATVPMRCMASSLFVSAVRRCRLKSG